MNPKQHALALVATGALAFPTLLAVTATGSCSLEGLAGGPAVSTASSSASSTSGASSSSGGGGDSGPSCPPDMVRIDSTIGSFCIDRLEVTNADYAVFAAAAGTAPQKHPPRCSWNTERASKSDAGSPKQPVVMVHWCNAFEYCSSVGKHLCGHMGGGAVELKDRDLANDQWLVACSGGLTEKYPYGTKVDYARCNDCDWAQGCVVDGGATDASHEPVLAEVGSFPECLSGGALDMSGSVWEWEDLCTVDADAGDNPAVDQCSRRGGSFAIPSATLGGQCLACFAATQFCSLSATMRNRAERQPDVGFRCCKELE